MFNVIIIDFDSKTENMLSECISEFRMPLNICETFNDGIAAISYLQSNSADIIIVDAAVPFTSGISLLSSIRTFSKISQIIVVSLPDKFSYAYAKDAIEAGAITYLLKPPDKNLFIQALTQCLSKLELDKLKNSFMDKITELTKKNTINELSGKFYAYISEHFSETISIKELASRFYITESYVNRLLVRDFGKTFVKLLNEIRIERAKILIKVYPFLTVEKIGEMVGFKDPYYFSRIYKTYTGYSPITDKNIAKSINSSFY